MRLPVAVVEAELDRPLPKLSPSGAALVVVRVHGHPVGAVLLQQSDTTDSSRAALRAWTELGSAINAHLTADGLPPLAGLDAWAAGRPASPFHRTRVAGCSAQRRRVLADAPPISVVVATRNRAEHVARCLRSILSLEYPTFEVIVVDNAPADTTTRELVADEFAGRVSYEHEERPGLAMAHNRGLAVAAGRIVAFTDDDVTVDPVWLTAIACAFDEVDRAGAVTGLIIPDELVTSAQVKLERHGAFAKGFRRRIFTANDRDRFMPFATARCGSGANMAFDAELLRRLGGFDPALGVGTVARGGDDLAAFFHVLTSGRSIVYEPSALIRHRHRAEEAALARQALSYGVGFGAYLAAALARRPALITRALRAAPDAIPYAWGNRPDGDRYQNAGWSRRLAWRERAGIVLGPLAYAVSRARLQVAPTASRVTNRAVGIRRTTAFRRP